MSFDACLSQASLEKRLSGTRWHIDKRRTFAGTARRSTCKRPLDKRPTLAADPAFFSAGPTSDKRHPSAPFTAAGPANKRATVAIDPAASLQPAEGCSEAVSEAMGGILGRRLHKRKSTWTFKRTSTVATAAPRGSGAQRLSVSALLSVQQEEESATAQRNASDDESEGSSAGLSAVDLPTFNQPSPEEDEAQRNFVGVPWQAQRSLAARRKLVRPCMKRQDHVATLEPEKADEGVAPTWRALKQTYLFEGFGESVLMALVERMEFRSFAAGETVWLQGDAEFSWLGVVHSGKAEVNLQWPSDWDAASAEPLMNRTLSQWMPMEEADNAPDSAEEWPGVAVAQLSAGCLMGELATLQVRRRRASTVFANGDGFSIWVLTRRDLLDVLKTHPDEQQLLEAAAARWNWFLGSALLEACPVEIAYQLRVRGTTRSLAPVESIQLGAGAEGELQRSAAILESGEASCMTSSSGPLLAGSVVCDSAVLGITGSATVVCGESECHLTLFTSLLFWGLLKPFKKLLEAFKLKAVQRLPSFGTPINNCTLLSWLPASPILWKGLRALTTARTYIPGEEIFRKDHASGVLCVVQHGAAEVFIHGHVVKTIQAGSHFGELGFVGAVLKASHTIRAVGICVVLQLNRLDFLDLLGSKELVKQPYFSDLLPTFQNLAQTRQHFRGTSASISAQSRLLEESVSFDRLPVDFLNQMLHCMEDCFYAPGQTICPENESLRSVSVLLEGSAEVVRAGGGVERTLARGASIGDIMALLLGGVSKDSATQVVAVSFCCVKVLHRALLIDCFAANPAGKRHFEEHVGRMEKWSRDSGTATHGFPIFKACSARLLQLIDTNLDRRFFFTDEVIVQEGSQGDCMYFVYKGKLDAIVGGSINGTLKEMDCFGETALLGLSKVRTATVVSKTLSDIGVLSRRTFEDLMREVPDELAPFEVVAAGRIRVNRAMRIGGVAQQTARFFKGCDLGFAEHLSTGMTDRIFQDGEVIFREGASGDWMILVHEGRAVVSAQGKTVGEVVAGEYAGELCCLNLAQLRTATVTAHGAVFGQVLYRSRLMESLQRFPGEVGSIRLVAARRLEAHSWPPCSITSVEQFVQSPRHFVDFLNQHMMQWTFFHGDIILEESCIGHHLIIVLSGRLQVEVGTEVLAHLGQGSLLGEMAALGYTERRSATVRCVGVCQICTIPSSLAAMALNHWPEQEARLRTLAAVRMRKGMEQLSNSDHLQRCELFKSCTSRFVELVASHMDDRLYLPGEIVCTEGEQTDSLFIVLQGCIDVTIHEKHIGQFTTGSVMGELVVLGLARVRTATLRACTVCLLQVLRSETLMRFLLDFPREMDQMQQLGARRMESTKVDLATDLFRRLPLFRGCARTFHDRVMEKLYRRIVFADQFVAQAGCNNNGEMFALVSGNADVVSDRHREAGSVPEGASFGELGLLGVEPTFPLSVLCVSMCHFQVLSAVSLEPLLAEFPAERRRLLHLVALQARDALESITDLEVLSEVQLFKPLGFRLVQLLSERTVLGLARPGELLSVPGQSILAVLLQGSAAVEAGGSPVIMLHEGDSHGQAAVLGLQRPAEAPSPRALTACLYLAVSRQTFEETLLECSGSVQSRVQKIRDSLQIERPISPPPPGLPNTVLDVLHWTRGTVSSNSALVGSRTSQLLQQAVIRLKGRQSGRTLEGRVPDHSLNTVIAGDDEADDPALSPLMQRFALTAEHLKQLCANCVDAAFMAGEELLCPDTGDEVMIFPLIGQVFVGGVQSGALMDESQILAAHVIRGSKTTGAVAATACRVLMLHRRSFLELVGQWSTDEKLRFIEQLEDLSFQETKEMGLRQYADQLTDKCLMEAVSRLRDGYAKALGSPRSSPHSKNHAEPRAQEVGHWNRASVALTRRASQMDRLATLATQLGARRQQMKLLTAAEGDDAPSVDAQSGHDESPPGASAEPAALSSEKVAFARDLQRYQMQARAVQDSSRRETERLRQEANELRQHLAALRSPEEVEAEASEAEIAALLRVCKASHRRLEWLGDQVQRALDAREDLMARLGSGSPSTSWC